MLEIFVTMAGRLQGNNFSRGCVAQWVECLTKICQLCVRTPSKAPVVSLSKHLYPHYFKYWLVPGTAASMIYYDILV